MKWRGTFRWEGGAMGSIVGYTARDGIVRDEPLIWTRGALEDSEVEADNEDDARKKMHEDIIARGLPSSGRAVLVRCEVAK
jgi:hypothetical protein